MESCLDTHINILNYPTSLSFQHDIITILSDSPIDSLLDCFIVIYIVVKQHIPFTLFLANRRDSSFDFPISTHDNIPDIKQWISNTFLFKHIFFKGYLSNKYLFFQINGEFEEIPSFDKHLFLMPDEIVNHQSSMTIPIAPHITNTFISFPDLFLLKQNGTYLPMPIVAFSYYTYKYSSFKHFNNVFVFFTYNYCISNKSSFSRFAIFNSHYLFSDSYTFFIVKHSAFFTAITI